MASIREELEERFKLLPTPPFFARLPDPQQYLTQLELARSPYLRSSRLVTVAEIGIDRCFEQPGIWFRVVGELKLQNVGTRFDFYHKPVEIYEYRRHGADIWLNAEWCIIYGSADTSLNLNVN